MTVQIILVRSAYEGNRNEVVTKVRAAAPKLVEIWHQSPLWCHISISVEKNPNKLYVLEFWKKAQANEDKVGLFSLITLAGNTGEWISDNTRPFISHMHAINVTWPGPIVFYFGTRPEECAKTTKSLLDPPRISGGPNYNYFAGGSGWPRPHRQLSSEIYPERIGLSDCVAHAWRSANGEWLA